MLKFCLVVILIALITYLTVRALDRRRAPRSGGRQQSPLGDVQRQIQQRLPRRHRPMAPDDDEEFLRDLGRKRTGNDSDD